MATFTSGNIPDFMEQGSRGPAVNLVLALLVGWAAKRSPDSHGVICDAEYGPNGIALMKAFQTEWDLDPDGGFGPATRGVFKSYFDFDFQAAACATGGTTTFVQPSGEQIVWTPARAVEARVRH